MNKQIAKQQADMKNTVICVFLNIVIEFQKILINEKKKIIKL